MCFTAIFCQKHGQSQHNRIFPLLTISETNTNRDGFAIRVNNRHMRTLNKNEAIQFLLENSDEDFVHLHYRLTSAGKTNKTNIHGFNATKFGFFFTHNGTLSTYRDFKAELSDSLIFAQTHEKEIRDALNGNLTPLTKLDFGAYNIVLISHLKKERALLISQGKPIQVYAWREKNSDKYNMAFASARISFQSVGLTVEDNIVINGWEFITKRIVENLDVSRVIRELEIHHNAFTNQVVLIDFEGNVLDYEVLTSKYSLLNSYNAFDYNDTDDDYYFSRKSKSAHQYSSNKYQGGLQWDF